MGEALLHWIVEHLPEAIELKFLEGFASALALLVFGYFTKSVFFQILAGLFPAKHTISRKNWHTAFVQNGKVKVERIELRMLPFRRVGGLVEYQKPGHSTVSKYVFDGRLTERFLTAMYKIKGDAEVDCGTWALRQTDEGDALVGGYAWLVDSGAIGIDFYQWTSCCFSDLLRNGASQIHGSGVFVTISLSEGGLVGEFKGVPVPAPTRHSIRVNGENIEPSQDCLLKFLNHSCIPNAYFKGGLLFLDQNISREDEITVDYRKTEHSFSTDFDCHCPKCRIARQPIKFRKTVE